MPRTVNSLATAGVLGGRVVRASWGRRIRLRHTEPQIFWGLCKIRSTHDFGAGGGGGVRGSENSYNEDRRSALSLGFRVEGYGASH